jgi:hypothetical protein
VDSGVVQRVTKAGPLLTKYGPGDPPRSPRSESHAMAFERRGKSGGTFFYLSVRTAMGVKKTYLGRGVQAQRAADAVAHRRGRREAERRAIQAERDLLRTADELTAELDAAATLLTEAVLLAAGFHRTNFGPWRRRRDHGRNKTAPAGGAG